MWSVAYLAVGMLVTLVALDALRSRARDPHGWRAAGALCIGMLLWPLALASLWYERARNAWTDARPNPDAWPQSHPPVKYRPHPRVTVTVRFPPRRVRHLGRVTVLHDPRLDFDAPVLIRPWGVTLSTPLGTFHLLKHTRVGVTTVPTASPSVPPHQQGFTLVELLVVIGVIGVLAGVLFVSLTGARASAQEKVARTYLQTCVANAEQRRSLITNTVNLPSSCEALGAERPANVQSSTIQLSGPTYTITVQASTGSGTVTLQEQVRRTITP